MQVGVFFLFCWFFSPLIRVQIVGGPEETVPSMRSNMKEVENLKVGEDSEQDQLEERLERGKRMKQQQISSWYMVIYALQSQTKEVSMKG